jgi:hypothetical protein
MERRCSMANLKTMDYPNTVSNELSVMLKPVMNL